MKKNEKINIHNKNKIFYSLPNYFKIYAWILPKNCKIKF